MSRVGLSVRSDNMRAIRFYEKDGWEVEQVTLDRVYFFAMWVQWDSSIGHARAARRLTEFPRLVWR